MSIMGEFGAGISALRIASAEPSSTRSVRSVKTLRIKKPIITALMMMKAMRPRRMMQGVKTALAQDAYGCDEENFGSAAWAITATPSDCCPGRRKRRWRRCQWQRVFQLRAQSPSR